MLIKTVRGFTPQWGSDCFIAENATLIGDLIMGDQCSVWYQAVIRGDVNSIRIGNRVNIQDGSVIHATYKKSKTTSQDLFREEVWKTIFLQASNISSSSFSHVSLHIAKRGQVLSAEQSVWASNGPSKTCNTNFVTTRGAVFYCYLHVFILRE